jgi:hypothetical protein
MSTPFTLIDDGRVAATEATMSHGRVFIGPEELREAIGWVLKPQGLCYEDVCVPVRDAEALVTPEGLDLELVADALGRPIAIDTEAAAAALAEPAADRSDALASLEAADFTLPDLEGNLHSLSDHRGKKVLLIAYASW